MEFIELFLMEADGRSQLDHGAHYKGIYSLKEKIKRSSKRWPSAKWTRPTLLTWRAGTSS